MNNCSKPAVPSIAPEDLLSTPAAHDRTDVLSPALPTDHSMKPGHSIPLSPADACADEDEVNAMLPTTSFIHSVLGNFAFAVFLISLAIFIVFFTATWLTVLQDARSMRDQVLSNMTGVSLPLCFNGCVCVLLTAAALGINTRPYHPTRSRCICVVHFMEGCILWCTHYL